MEHFPPDELKLISIYIFDLDLPATRAQLEEVEKDHQTEEDGRPGDVDETSDGGDGDAPSLTLHGGESHRHGRLLYYIPQL